ncbi:MAG TPA: hypothetical protein VFK47_20365, partial [Ktedonobacteraceae bacterium]|nr:hypothetical protein [Ktedonobacteraceae bacterium]
MRTKEFSGRLLTLAVIALSIIVILFTVGATSASNAFSQRMVIYNTTGNTTDAKGATEMDWKNLPANITTLYPVGEPKTTQEGVNEPNANTPLPEAHSIPSNAKVMIREGAALKGNQAYSPDVVEILQGGTISWINADTVTHTVTSGRGFSDPEMGKTFDSGLIGGHYNKDFNAAGEYPYFC